MNWLLVGAVCFYFLDVPIIAWTLVAIYLIRLLTEDR